MASQQPMRAHGSPPGTDAITPAASRPATPKTASDSHRPTRPPPPDQPDQL